MLLRGDDGTKRKVDGVGALVEPDAVPQCGNAAAAPRGERLRALGIDVLEIDARLQAERDDPGADACALGIREPVIEDELRRRLTPLAASRSPAGRSRG